MPELIAKTHDEAGHYWTIYAYINHRTQELDFESASCEFLKGKNRVFETTNQKRLEKYLKCKLEQLNWYHVDWGLL